MSILPPFVREWRRGDHVALHDLPYTVLRLDITGHQADLTPGNDCDHAGAVGRVTASVDLLTWRA